MADDFDWLNNYWPQINYEQSVQNSLFRDAPDQVQQNDSGQNASMDLTSWFLAQQPPGPTRPDLSQSLSQHQPFPYFSPYATNRAPRGFIMQPSQPPQPTPATSFQSHYPTPFTTPSMHPTPAQTAASALSLAQTQMDIDPPAPAPAPAPVPTSAPKPKPKPKPPRDLSGYSFTPRDPSSKALRDRGDLVQPLNEADAADKVVYDSNTIARDILIAAGRHPTEPTLNHHLSRLRDVLTQVDNTSDLSTFRWDIVDSPAMQVPPTKVPPTKVPPTKAPPTMPPKQPVANGHHTPQHHQQPLQPLSAGPPSRDQHPITTPRPTPPSRPPQQQQKQQQPPSQKQPAPLQHMVSVQLPPQSPHPSQQKTSPPRRKSIPAQIQPQRQRKTPNKPKQQTEKMVGKKSTSGPKIEVAIPRPASVSYPVYSCEWQDCQSELHSLALLRQHLLKSHIPYTITCGWTGCTCTEKMAASDLSNHVKTEHLEPIAWKLGDGPAVPGTGETS